MQDMTIIFPQKICKLQADLLFLWSDDVVCVVFFVEEIRGIYVKHFELLV